MSYQAYQTVLWQFIMLLVLISLTVFEVQSFSSFPTFYCGYFFIVIYVMVFSWKYICYLHFKVTEFSVFIFCVPVEKHLSQEVLILCMVFCIVLPCLSPILCLLISRFMAKTTVLAAFTAVVQLPTLLVLYQSFLSFVYYKFKKSAFPIGLIIKQKVVMQIRWF